MSSGYGLHLFTLSTIPVLPTPNLPKNQKVGETGIHQVIPSQWNRGGSAVGMKACQKGAELNFNPSHS